MRKSWQYFGLSLCFATFCGLSFYFGKHSFSEPKKLSYSDFSALSKADRKPAESTLVRKLTLRNALEKCLKSGLHIVGDSPGVEGACGKHTNPYAALEVIAILKKLSEMKKIKLQWRAHNDPMYADEVNPVLAIFFNSDKDSCSYVATEHRPPTTSKDIPDLADVLNKHFFYNQEHGFRCSFNLHGKVDLDKLSSGSLTNLLNLPADVVAVLDYEMSKSVDVAY